jgi:hypothetical protein
MTTHDQANTPAVPNCGRRENEMAESSRTILRRIAADIEETDGATPDEMRQIQVGWAAELRALAGRSWRNCERVDQLTWEKYCKWCEHNQPRRKDNWRPRKDGVAHGR